MDETIADTLSRIGTRSGASRDPSPRITPGPFHLVVKRLRLDLGLSQRELALRSGMKQPHICAFEAGKAAALSTYERLIEAMGHAPVYGIEAMKPRSEIIAELVAERLAAESRLRERRWQRRVSRRSR
ncbi:MAG: helix-turn-helix domain-containing protein [Elusimicrobiota bacterium]